MKQLGKFISHACIYTVLFSLIFCSFSGVVKRTGISLSSYLLIFSFSLILSSMEYIFTVKKIPTLLQYVIHYVTLCTAFNIIFVALRKSDPDYEFRASMIFASIFLFSVIYALVFLAVYLIHKSQKTVSKKKKGNANASSYKSRFK